jgi:hypothetical protein
MPRQAPIAVEVSLAETCGPFGKVGWPRLYCWFKAVHVPGTSIDDAKISVLARVDSTKSWQEHTRRLTLEQAQDIVESLQKLGIPEKSIQVEGVVDSSDGWSALYVRVQVDTRVFALDIHMQSSGFEGDDAEELRGFFRQLFERAGYADYCPATYGQPPR